MDLFTNLSLFSGAGGLDLDARALGHFRTVCYVEHDRYAQATLMSRIRDGHLDQAPIWDDVQSFDGRSWRGLVDIVSGGFPCQDISRARVGKREGLAGKKSGLWFHFLRIIKDVAPICVLIENVPRLRKDGLGLVLEGLWQSGFDALWYCLAAGSLGAPHRRDRIWVVAFPQHTDPDCLRLDRTPFHKYGRPELWGTKLQDYEVGFSRPMVSSFLREGIEPKIFRMVDGLAHRSHRLRLCGNGVARGQSIPAWEIVARVLRGK